jgi:hypothetical protein
MRGVCKFYRPHVEKKQGIKPDRAGDFDGELKGGHGMGKALSM